jgi:hypothetical protein
VRWEQYRVWSIWIVGGRYITVLSSYFSFLEVMEAATEEAEKLGVFSNSAPLVLVTNHFLHDEQVEHMKGLPEGQVSLIME